MTNQKQAGLAPHQGHIAAAIAQKAAAAGEH